MKMETLLTFKNLLKKDNIKPSKKLGQNFLIDKSVLGEIIKAAELSPQDIVLEIGPGLGILTFELAKRVKQVIAVEKDRRMCEILKNELNARNVRNVEIVNIDILNSKYQLPATSYKLLANIPYYITSPIIRKFLEADNQPKLMVLMVQKEVAQRICARTQKGFRGKMSVLSVAVQFYAQPKIISYVSKKSFYPQPKVDSAIIKIVPKPIPQIDTNKLFKLVRAGFSSKRKFLINNLSRELKIENCKLKIVFDQIGLGQKLRAENLSVDDWVKLSTILHYIDI